MSCVGSVRSHFGVCVFASRFFVVKTSHFATIVWRMTSLKRDNMTVSTAKAQNCIAKLHERAVTHEPANIESNRIVLSKSAREEFAVQRSHGAIGCSGTRVSDFARCFHVDVVSPRLFAIATSSVAVGSRCRSGSRSG